MTGEWNLKVGTEITRAEVAARFGDSKFGGIEPSNTSPNVILYSDVTAAYEHGYSFDGWAEDGEVYFYTGEGAGNQVLTSGNKAIFEHLAHGRALRLFEATGRSRKPTGGKIHRYVGRFQIDPNQPFVYDRAQGKEGMREVIVFRLLPVDDVWRDDHEPAPLPPSDTGHRRMVPVERVDAVWFTQSATGGTSTAARRESLLTSRYQVWLEDQGHKVVRWSIRLPGARSPLYTDLYDVQEKELYEAKGTVKRADVRMAIGQLLDYRRHIDIDVPRLAVLLPERPSDDLISLINSCDMSCVYATGPDSFERVDS